MRLNLKKAVTGAVGVATIATLAPLVTATTAGAAGVSAGTPTLSTSSGDSTTDFTMTLPAGAACNEDSAAGGWTITSFMVPTTTDLSTLTFDPSGPAPAETGSYSTFRQPLWLTTKSSFVSIQTVNASPPDPTGPIQSPPAFDFDPGYSAGDIPAGAYNIGIACLDETFAIQQYWATKITVSANAADPGTAKISWVQGATPQQPTISGVTPGDQTLQVAFTAPTSVPANSSYTATATPQGGGTPVSISGAGSPLSITGLTNGTTYDVTVTATNPVGTSAPSTAVSGTPSRAQLAAPVVTATPLTGGIKATWTAAGGSPTGYTVTVSPDPTTGPYSVTVPATDPREVDITNLAAGVDHTVTVTAIYADPQDVGTPGTATAKPNSDVTVSQTIQAERPAANALVLTQECGNPQCLVDLGTGVLDSTGSYFEATGDLFPVTLTDARDLDLGWTVKGDIADEFQATGDSFDAVALGWTPEVTTFSPQLANGYAQGVVAGPVVAPNEASAPIVNGNAVLMQSVAPGANTGGLGIAKATAGLTLRIPVTAAAGTYTAVLTLSAI